MTAGARREDCERCLAAGMDNYLAKPVSKDALLALVGRYAGGPAVNPAPRTNGGGISAANQSRSRDDGTFSPAPSAESATASVGARHRRRELRPESAQSRRKRPPADNCRPSWGPVGSTPGRIGRY